MNVKLIQSLLLTSLVTLSHPPKVSERTAKVAHCKQLLSRKEEAWESCMPLNSSFRVSLQVLKVKFFMHTKLKGAFEEGIRLSY